MPAVEAEITTLAGHLAAGTCRFLQLLAAFDTGGGWHGCGMRTCAQWLSWRCGLSTSAAREQLRVAHALGSLPEVTAAFTAGRISYSKARALSRVATPENEHDLLATATACTAAQLDRLCAGLRRARSNDEILDQAARASLRAVWEDDGTLRISGRLSAEDGAVLLAALAQMREPAVVDPDGAAATPDAGAAAAEGARDSGDEQATDAGATRTPGAPQGASAEAPPTGSEPGLPGDEHRDAGARAARSDAAALIALARHALDQPPPDASAAPVRLIVHTAQAALLRDEPGHASAETPPRPDPASAEAPAAGVLDAGPGIPLLPLGPDTLRRLACQALVEPATSPTTLLTQQAGQATDTPGADGTGSPPPASAAPSCAETAAAPSPAAPADAACTPTTACTGPPAAPPPSRTSSSPANTTTCSCTKADGSYNHTATPPAAAAGPPSTTTAA